MKKQLESVETFHNVFGQENGEFPRLLTHSEYNLRHSLMREENDEYLDACAAKDIIEVADALGDQLYILCGTILRHGMQHVIENVFDEIHASNMSKLDKDGEPIFRLDGKILKGPNFFRPDLTKFIKQ